MDPLQQIKVKARRLVVVEGDDPDEPRTVYQIRRVNPLDLMRLGVAAIPGVDNAARLAQEAQESLEREVRLSEVTDPEARAKVEAELQAQQAHLRAQMEGALMKDPRSLEALMVAIDAFVMLGVEALGVALPDVPVGLQPTTATPEQVCAPFELPGGKGRMLLRPVAIVEAVTGPDQLALVDLPPAARASVAGAVREAFLGGSRVAKTFRGAPGDGGAAGLVGEAVRAAAVVVPAADPGGAGDRGHCVPRGKVGRSKTRSRGR